MTDYVKPGPEQMRGSLEHIQRLKEAILKLNRAAMTEMSNFNYPPQLVKDVMMAVLLILGDPESETRDWGKCRKLMSTIRTKTYPGFFSRIKDYDFKYLNPEIATRANTILEGVAVEQLEQVSRNLSLFYKWAMGIVKHSLADADTNTNTQPAEGKNFDSRNDADADTNTQPAEGTNFDSRNDADADTNTQPAEGKHFDSRIDADADTNTQPAEGKHFDSRNDAN